MKLHLYVLLASIVVVTAIVAPASAQLGFDSLGKPVSVETFTSLSSVPQGGSVKIALAITTKGHWHINANQVNDEFLIPTTVEIKTQVGVHVAGVAYPDGVEKKLGFSDEPLLLYEGTTYIGAIVDVARDVRPGIMSLTVALTYQACDNEKCLAPETEMISIPMTVSPSTEAVDITHAEIFGKIDFSGIDVDGTGAGTAASVASSGRLGSLIAGRGWVFAFLMVFVWGLALNLTPCVYPMIPITVGFFGSQSGGKTINTLGLAFVYVLGMASMYSVLGLIAALTGSIFGTALQSPIVVLLIVGVMIALAFSMFGYYEIRVPARLANLAGMSTGKQGPIGAFLMGLTVGIVAAPCVGPFVIALLTFVGESGSPVIGFTLFFTLALGLGAPFMVLAVVSGNISKLPKSGEWMEWIKKVFGIIMVGMAVFFLQPLINDMTYAIMIAAVAVIGGVVVGFVIKTHTRSIGFRAMKVIVGVVGILLGARMLMPVINPPPAEASIAWQVLDDTLIDRAKADGKFVVIDFTAEWCLPCQELDHLTFSQPAVIEATRDMITLRADLTQSASPGVAEIRRLYKIRGVPTVVFLDKNGRERSDLRVFGFVDEQDFLAHLDKLKSGG